MNSQLHFCLFSIVLFLLFPLSSFAFSFESLYLPHSSTHLIPSFALPSFLCFLFAFFPSVMKTTPSASFRCFLFHPCSQRVRLFSSSYIIFPFCSDSPRLRLYAVPLVSLFSFLLFPFVSAFSASGGGVRKLRSIYVKLPIWRFPQNFMFGLLRILLMHLISCLSSRLPTLQ